MFLLNLAAVAFSSYYYLMVDAAAAVAATGCWNYTTVFSVWYKRDFQMQFICSLDICIERDCGALLKRKLIVLSRGL